MHGMTGEGSESSDPECVLSALPKIGHFDPESGHCSVTIGSAGKRS
jgi:hypothetical protein